MSPINMTGLLSVIIQCHNSKFYHTVSMLLQKFSVAHANGSEKCDDVV